jgi:hypothetical protein
VEAEDCLVAGRKTEIRLTADLRFEIIVVKL